MTDRAAEILRKLVDGGECLLCGGKPSAVGAWHPTAEASARLGNAPGRRSYVLYVLCGECGDRPGLASAVEGAILREADDRQMGRPDRN